MEQGSYHFRGLGITAFYLYTHLYTEKPYFRNLFLNQVHKKEIGGERGIRTLDTLLTYTHFPGVLLKPLGHLS